MFGDILGPRLGTHALQRKIADENGQASREKRRDEY
jgi:hypothetical protein